MSETSAGQDLDSANDRSQPNQFLPAILLAYFASQNRSLLAAECLIETVIEMYRRGTQLDSLQFTLSMATLQSGSTLLSEQELDILTARCGIIMLTLHEIGCATYERVTTTDFALDVLHSCRARSLKTKHTISFQNAVTGLSALNTTNICLCLADPYISDLPVSQWQHRICGGYATQQLHVQCIVSITLSF